MSHSSQIGLLVVDDDESIRELLCLLLESEGYEALAASSAQETLAIVNQEENSIQGVVLDLNLNGSKGEELYDEIAAIRPELPIFLISGCNYEEVEERLGDRPVAGIINKPFRSADLFKTIAKGVCEKSDRFSGERI